VVLFSLCPLWETFAWEKTMNRIYFTKKMLSVLSFLLLCVFGFSFSLSAQEQQKAADLTEKAIEEEIKWLQAEAINITVVTASRTEIPLLKASKSISVISQQDIESAQEYFLPKMLDNMPGVFFKRQGGVGQFSRINMRGTDSQYVQFQYNGIPLKDVADMQNTFQPFIQDLYLGNSHRVEVLRGTNSTLYGSQAMSGVINMIPDKWNRGFKAELRSEIGEHSTFIETGRIAYGEDKYYIDLNPVYVNSDGEKNGGIFDYYYKKSGFCAGGGIKSGDVSLEFNSLFSDNDVAMGSSPSLDTEGNLMRNQADKSQHHENQFRQTGIVLNHSLSSLWDYTLKGSYSKTQRHYFYSDISEDMSGYGGNTAYFELQNNIHVKDWLSLIAGADYERSEYDEQQPMDKYQGRYDAVHFEHDWDSWDVFGNLQFSFLGDSLRMNVGARYSDHEKFDAKGVWEASAAYISEKYGTKIYGHIGTGYRTPSFYETYGGYLLMGQFVTVGNENLQPEESISCEIGLEQFFTENRIHAGITYFTVNFDNLVNYDFSESRYKNASEAKSQGIEAYLNIMPCRYFKAGIAYTHTNPEYKESVTGEWADREHFPKNKVNITACFYPSEKLTAFCRIGWTDEKTVPLYDINFNQIKWKEDRFTVADLAITYKISKNIEAWVKADNLFDEDYTEGGYTMPGPWIYGGVKVIFAGD